MMHPPTPGQRVVWHTTMSLDGFIAAPGDRMDWVFEQDFGQGRTARWMVERLGALLVGRRTMDVEDRERPGFYGGAFTGPFFVLTHDTGRPAPVVKGATGRVLAMPLPAALSQAREAAGGADVGLLGASVGQQALTAGLLDEVVVQVAPLLLGSGTPMFHGLRQRLEPVDTCADGGLTTLRFTVPR